MIGSLPVLALAAFSAVQASPLERRQATTTITMAAAASGASTTAAPLVSGVTMTAAPAAATAANTTTGNETYSGYPCPVGYELTYVAQNISLPIPITQAVSAFGAWASSPFFPNVSMVSGANAVGDSHTINVGGVNLNEMLVGVIMGGPSGSAQWTWNLTNGPATIMGVGVSNYSTVLALYDPGYTATNMTGTNSTALLYTNFCANSQPNGMSLLTTLDSLELGSLASLVSSNSSTPAMNSSSTAAPAAAMTTAAPAVTVTSTIPGDLHVVPSMLSSVSSFISKRRRGLTVVASIAGGAYLLTQYARQRFADLSERLVLDRAAKEKRFQQNQEDCAFTVLALLPTLSKQVLEELNVEALTAELQRRAEDTKRGKPSGSHPAVLDDSTASLQPPSDSLKNLLEHQPNGHIDRTEYQLTKEAAQIPMPNGGPLEAEALQSDRSVQTNGLVEEPISRTLTPPPLDPRTKAELWQDTKLLTFHRTVTTLYLLSLLSLQTHIQLNLLGRHNYVSSVYSQATFASSGSSVSLPLESDAVPEDIFLRTSEKKGRTALDLQTEKQYLTLSWWFLQRGWRQVSERVREVTAEALESVSLKSQLGLQELNSLLLDIRRKVEYKATGAVHSFASALFPLSAADEQETMQESGLSLSPNDTSINQSLRNLLNETQDFVDSPDFSIVLRSCLDKSFAQLSSSLAHLFVDEQRSLPSLPQGNIGVGVRRFEELQEKKVRLAAILPALARASHVVLNGMQNEYAEALEENREMMEFSVVVYSNFALEQ
ncbi:MAG: peroxin [Cyphobasidiales sp. Tagirdzhanova-0007]|nr:MAG: peroxin [Cyphobasidiales sp. Tagirdzhanova-0007]